MAKSKAKPKKAAKPVQAKRPAAPKKKVAPAKKAKPVAKAKKAAPKQVKVAATKARALNSTSAKAKSSVKASPSRSTGSKIATGIGKVAAVAASAVAGAAVIRAGATRTSESASAVRSSMPASKSSLKMPATSENKKEIAPGGGIVQPATKNAPAMRLRPDDAEILATAKERYGRKDLEAFKNLLIEQRQEAREEFDILSQNIMDTSGEFEADNQTYSLHTAEQGTDAIEREKTFLHAQRTSDYIKKLDEALERIERGTYGICVICGKLIEKQRLQAVPITQKHVDCKNRTQVRRISSEGFRDMEEQPAAE
jgi:DnaK suppressor protein